MLSSLWCELFWTVVGELLVLLLPFIDGVARFKLISGGMRPSFIRFFCFMRRFWNHIFTWVSFNCSADAISILRALVKYLLKWNSFSNSVSCLLVKLVLPLLFNKAFPPFCITFELFPKWLPSSRFPAALLVPWRRFPPAG